MVLFYGLESRHPGYTLAFAFSCALGSAYGFLQGAWPFGIAEGFWCVVAVKKWFASKAGRPERRADRLMP
jgi:hypothetical protein